MVTLGKLETTTNKIVNEMVIYGISGDDQPTTTVEGYPVINGAHYIEIDTGKKYLFDAENETWYEEGASNA